MITADNATDTAFRLRPDFGARRYVDVEGRIVFGNASPDSFYRLEFGRPKSSRIVKSELGVGQTVPTRSFGTAEIEVNNVVCIARHTF